MEGLVLVRYMFLLYRGEPYGGSMGRDIRIRYRRAYTYGKIRKSKKYVYYLYLIDFQCLRFDILMLMIF